MQDQLQIMRGDPEFGQVGHCTLCAVAISGFSLLGDLQNPSHVRELQARGDLVSEQELGGHLFRLVVVDCLLWSTWGLKEGSSYRREEKWL